MRATRPSLLTAGLILLTTCGSDVLEPGALTITLTTAPPGVTNAATVGLTGQVTRTPADARAVLVVTATGGSTAATDTAGADGAFSLTIGLTANAINQLQISASDASGSTATPVSVAVRHDNAPPTVASSTPAHEADAVTAGTYAVVFTEPVRPGTATITVRQQSVPVAGAAALSADSLTLTFTPTDPFAPNAIHDVTVGGARDEAGNTSPNAARCFVTGGAAVTSVSDPEDDFFVTSTPPNASLVPIDLLEMRFARTTGVLFLLARFDASRSLALSAPNNVTGVVDLDLDQDGVTGFLPLKDLRLGEAIGDSSGAGAEALIELGDWVGSDSAFAGVYTAQTSVTGVAFVASACGALVGWAVPLDALGGADDAFDVVAYFDTFDAVGAYADGAPDLGVYSVALTPSAGSLLGAAAGRLPLEVTRRGSVPLVPRRPAIRQRP